MAATARRRYGCLTPWERDPAIYGQAVLSGSYQDCEEGVLSVLRECSSAELNIRCAMAIAFSTPPRMLD
jgi:hypothetical protein